MDTESIGQESSQPAAVARPLLRHPLDWLLGLAVLAGLPLVGCLCVDLWFRTDLKFFPLLPLASLWLVGRHGQLATHDLKRRSYWTLGLISLSGLVAVLAAIVFSSWLALFSLLLAWIGWMLQRMGDTPWYRIVGWTLPLWVLLLLPNSDVSDATRSMEVSVARSSSILLDLLSVPQLRDAEMLQLRSGTLSSSSVCRGLGNPYLLLALVVLQCLWTQRSFLAGLLTVATVPLWAWLGAVVYMVAGAYAWEEYERFLFGSYRSPVIQTFILIVLLLFIRGLQFGLQQLLSPFTAYTSISNDVHKGFNWLVLWPAKDPLRKRKSLDEEARVRMSGNIVGLRPAVIALSAAGIALIAAGGWSTYRVVVEESANRILPWTIAKSPVEQALVGFELPLTLDEMRQVDFDMYYDPDSHFSEQYRARWRYLVGLQSAEIALEFPWRGFYPVEQGYLTPVSRMADARQSYAAEVDGLGEVLLDEVILLDELYGRSYLCYATFTLGAAPPLRTAASEQRWSWPLISNSLALQPTVFTVQLFLEGTERLSEEQRGTLRESLLTTCQSLAQPLRAATERQPTGPE